MENLAYQDEYREEMHDGKIVSMAPPFINHSVIAGNIFFIFKKFLKGKPCDAFSDWGYVHFSKKDKVIPDIMIICNRDIVKRNGIYGTPDLIVEVISPGTAKYDRGYKKRLYEKHGVKEYWIVEPETRSIEVYLLKDIFMLDEVYSYIPDYLLEDLTEDEKNNLKDNLYPSLFPDMEIMLADVFDSRYY